MARAISHQCGIEALSGVDEPATSLLDKVAEGHAAAPVGEGYAAHQGCEARHQPLLGLRRGHDVVHQVVNGHVEGIRPLARRWGTAEVRRQISLGLVFDCMDSVQRQAEDRKVDLVPELGVGGH